MKQLIDLDGTLYDDSDLVPRQAVLAVIDQVTELDGTPFQHLPFWQAMQVLFSIWCRPFTFAQMVVRVTKNEVRAGVEQIKGR